MRSITEFLQRFGLTFVEVALGVTFLWFGTLLISGQTPLMPFFQVALPQYPTMQLMWSVGMVEVLLGLGLLLPIVSLGAAVDRAVLHGALLLELLYGTALMLNFFISSAHIFSPQFPVVSAFGYFTLHKVLLLLAALLVTAHRFPEEARS